VLIPSDL